jgi:hypothetical protein
MGELSERVRKRCWRVERSWGSEVGVGLGIVKAEVGMLNRAVEVSCGWRVGAG